MQLQVAREPGQTGFTLLELMMAVAVIGVLAAIAIPLLTSYQLRSKSAEAKTNLGAIRVLEETYYSENQTYRSANAEPAAVPGSVAVAFDGLTSDFQPLGFVPQGPVYFSYGVAVSDDGAGFTADAAADIDGDGFVQYWGYSNPDGNGAMVAGKVGCDTAGLQPKSVGPCTASSGQSTF
ncbi:MAG: prepilin-type N-terminal cleavage/methylation domain-containing protein [Deltaproteobacteria bacterium]|jgi:prepilin-type N-terminal cleavage/methylation domain-containing protein|nr:prepilin-type N-terminal cleavage/methylation domain-containing protein [Deltaproteobacteria bacterium]